VTLNCRENLPNATLSRLATVRRPVAFALALGLLAVLSMASCGGGDDAKLLPGATANEITENLDRVRQLVAEGECIGAADAAREVGAQVEALAGVDAKLKRALESGAGRLNEVVDECEEASTEAVAPPVEVPTTESTEPPGQEKKREKELEKAEKEAEKEAEKAEKEKPAPPSPPPATTPETQIPPTEEAPPVEGGGTGAPGGVSPGAPVGEGE
jgi:hypothetical protein